MNDSYQLLGAYPGQNLPAGSTMLGRCDFVFKPGLAPLALTRSYKKEDGTYGDQDIGQVVGAEGTLITLRGCRVGEKNGRAYIMHDAVQIPRDVADMVAVEAVASIRARLVDHPPVDKKKPVKSAGQV
jgi:hypothetical protein